MKATVTVVRSVSLEIDFDETRSDEDYIEQVKDDVCAKVAVDFQCSMKDLSIIDSSIPKLID